MNTLPYKMKYLLLLVSVLLNGFCSIAQSDGNDKAVGGAPIEILIQNLKDSKSDQVMVVAHRGKCGDGPENSLRGIQKCIDMGVDMVEIDLEKTKDGQLVLMHDKTINRTTHGKGAVKKYTLSELKTYYLNDDEGRPTQRRFPRWRKYFYLPKIRSL
ncbi:MAG: glycerophosphodiester phosphodiesterase family protein [Flavobacteriaceae bacterium]|nr:glycerophosphodiester phosphodiesterase family protein [Flavobacteriaceae bacterium]